MPLDPARVEDTRAWLVRAAADLRAAEHDLTAVPPLLADVTFHSQQAAEKSLKSFLTWHDHPFHKTHDLVQIGHACVGLDPTLEPLLRAAAPLTEYAWRYRYPGDPTEPSLLDAQAALTVARQVYHGILARLPDEVKP